jgi:D-xylose transport system ATP-binding protein
VFAVADYISVLYLGQLTASVKASDVTTDDVVGYITGSKTYTGEMA